jgi:DNA-binding transcriptional ArsR family regulator
MNAVKKSDNLDTIFNALGNGKRRGILDTLSYRPSTVSQLADEYDLSLPAIHKHIRVLEDAELIFRKKVGRINFVALNQKSLSEAQIWIMKFQTYWGTNQDTLENYISSVDPNFRT